MEEAVLKNLLGGAAGEAPPPENLLTQATAHALAKNSAHYVPCWGEGKKACLRLGQGFRRPPEAEARGGRWLRAVTSGAAESGITPCC